MTSISDLPSDPIYTIKAVSSRTGILPVTLRAWERRYDILNPQRSENRYRLYSERDVAILRWLLSRLESDLSISSAVAEFNNLIHSGYWPEEIPDLPNIEMARTTRSASVYVKRLYRALVNKDEARSDVLLKELLTSFDLITIYEEVITPCLHEIGDAWYRGEIHIATEHYASAYLRSKLAVIFHSYPPGRGSPKVLVGAAPSELHEIGALMIATLLRSKGYRIEYLGPDIPLVDLVDYTRYEKPAIVILSASLIESAKELTKFRAMLNEVKSPVLFGFGGRAFDIQPDLRQKIDGIFLGETIQLALQKIEKLVPLK